LNENSQKLFKKVRNSHYFGLIQARELQLLSFCAYGSSPYDLILKIWNFGIFLNNVSPKLLKEVRNDYNFGVIQSRELHLVLFCVCWSSPYDLKQKNLNFGIFVNKTCPKLLKKVRNGYYFAKYKLQSFNWYHFESI
jgi:hypothetical protein